MAVDQRYDKDSPNVFFYIGTTVLFASINFPVIPPSVFSCYVRMFQIYLCEKNPSYQCFRTCLDKQLNYVFVT